MLLNPLDHILGARSKVRLLRVLAPLDRPLSGREATRLAGISHQGIRALDELVEMGVVARQAAAGQHLYRFNRDSSLAPVLERLFGSERERTSLLFARLAEAIGDDRMVAAAVVFGSSARGDAQPDSDLDILVVTENTATAELVHARLVEAADRVEREFGAVLSPVVITLRQAQRLHEDRDPFISEVLREGRLIRGKALEEALSG